MAEILFLAPRDLGETILATGVLAQIVRPGDVLTVSASEEAASLFRAAPATRIWLPRPAVLSFCAFARAHGARYETLIDGQRRLAGRIAPAARKIRLRPAPVLQHRVEAWGIAAGTAASPAPTLWIDAAARAEAASIVPQHGRLLVLAPGGAGAAKRWPWERFAATARRLLGGVLAGAQVLVLGAAARDREVASALVRSLDADGIAAIDAGGKLDLLAAGALLERATLCLGNDNVLTHIAAAAQAPTLTLFGPTDERVRAPYGPRARTLRGAPWSVSLAQAQASMRALSVDAVEAAAIELLHAGGLT